jgi:hypothetical protein
VHFVWSLLDSHLRQICLSFPFSGELFAKADFELRFPIIAAVANICILFFLSLPFLIVLGFEGF